MQVKTFEAVSVKDAVKAVKKEFGADAVILSTREKYSPGPERLKTVEVTAAVPQNPRSVQGAARSAAKEANDLGFLAERVNSLDAKLNQIQENTASKLQYQSLENGLQELKSLVIEALRGKSESPLSGLPEALVGIDRALRATGVDATIIAQLMKHLRALSTDEPQLKAGGAPLIEFYRSHAMRWMLKKIRIAPRWEFTPGNASIHAFVGSSGCGKTSLIAKIAAQYHAREKAKVLVVSADNNRLAASEQLRVYCKIIGVPFQAISAPEDLAQTLLSHRDRDLVLVDTAGRPIKSTANCSDILALRDGGLAVDIHLVAATTDKAEQIDRAIRHFSPLAIQSLAFTRLDESWSFGEIFNLSSKWSLPLSFFSTGQVIPDDLERATRERVVERIFGV